MLLGQPGGGICGPCQPGGGGPCQPGGGGPISIGGCTFIGGFVLGGPIFIGLFISGGDSIFIGGFISGGGGKGMGTLLPPYICCICNDLRRYPLFIPGGPLFIGGISGGGSMFSSSFWSFSSSL